MTFEKYASIENSYREKFIELIRGTTAAQDTWFVTEKIHGSNFSIIYDGNEFKFASRGGILEPGDSFFGYQDVVKDKLKAVLQIYSILSVDKEPEELVIYGEIFGPGIQKGVNYGKKDFRFFDIKVNGQFLDQVELQRFSSDDLLMVPQLCFGKFDTVLNFNCEFNSLILGQANNPAEGVVLKPNTTLFLDPDNRVILKKKHPKFSEIAHASNVKQEKGEVFIPLPLAKFITLNRLDNVFSKIEPTFKNFNAIQAEFISDILKDAAKEFPNNEFVDPDGGVEVITDPAGLIKNECAKMIREEIKKRQ